jgi:branched-chain amino acid transport system ATP-binding protein
MLLSVENLRVSYDNIKALHGISFRIDEGETKMTCMGKNLLNYPADKVVSELGISHVPEGRRLFDNLTVMENLRLATFARRDGKAVGNDMDRVFSIFPRLKERQSQKAGTLSGGEQQMLAVGRAFVSGRKIMLLDEPSMGLAPLLMMSVFDSLKEINREGTTILVVEQNARLALQFAGRGYVLENGRIALEDGAEELLVNPRVKKAYLGG